MTTDASEDPFWETWASACSQRYQTHVGEKTQGNIWNLNEFGILYILVWYNQYTSIVCSTYMCCDIEFKVKHSLIIQMVKITKYIRYNATWHQKHILYIYIYNLHVVIFTYNLQCQKSTCASKVHMNIHTSLYVYMGVSLNGGFPPISHPKCWSFLVGKPMGLLGKPTILGNFHINIYIYNFSHGHAPNIFLLLPAGHCRSSRTQLQA